MDYNSNRKKLVLPEYGRNIQNMVDHIMTIEDREERNRAANRVIDVMGNLYTYLRDIDDFKHKLWDHIAIMSNFELDIYYHYDPSQPSLLTDKPNTVPYTNARIKYRHYGNVLETMITTAANYEEGEDRDYLIRTIVNHMKKSFLNWNKDAVDDSKIKDDLRELSKGKIDLPEDYVLTETKSILAVKPQKKNNQKRDNRGKRRN